jgi:Tat protein secretion system quality control protein TatD with DNase activity
MAEHRMSCPCCAFYLSNDLFLPKQSEERSRLLDHDKESSSADDSNKQRLSTGSSTIIGLAGGVVMSTAQAWKLLQQEKRHSDDTSDNHNRALPIVVDTHGHAHLEREDEQQDSTQAAIYRLEDDVVAEISPLSSSIAQTTNTASEELQQQQHQQSLPTACFISLTCAVQQADWDACLAYAASSPYRMAAIGIHPWYLADLTDDWLLQLERILQQHAGVMVGEIGLCKMARFLRTYEHGKTAALALQRSVFVQQLQLAAVYQRPVSIHCVNQQGVLLGIFKEQQQHKLQLPPAMALHSFTGTAHHVKLLLAWEATLKLAQPLLYFGFSHAVNHAMCSSEKSRRQCRQAICSIPHDRLLAESDLHVTSHILGGTVASIAHLAWALDQDVVSVAQLTRDNALRVFFQSLNGGVVTTSK